MFKSKIKPIENGTSQLKMGVVPNIIFLHSCTADNGKMVGTNISKKKLWDYSYLIE